MKPRELAKIVQKALEEDALTDTPIQYVERVGSMIFVEFEDGDENVTITFRQGDIEQWKRT